MEILCLKGKVCKEIFTTRITREGPYFTDITLHLETLTSSNV